jgi:hypothetical protein
MTGASVGGRTPRAARRRVCLSILLVTLLLLPLACKRRKVQVQPTDEETPRMASILNMGDPKAESQLVSGFHGIEAGAWRWTARSFTVVLRPPFGAAQKGATLQMKLTVPPVVIEKLKTISLSATVSGSELPPETYTQAGDYTYKRDLSPSLIAGDSLRIDFHLDKAMPPSGADIRELGIIVLSVGLETK